MPSLEIESKEMVSIKLIYYITRSLDLNEMLQVSCKDCQLLMVEVKRRGELVTICLFVKTICWCACFFKSFFVYIVKRLGYTQFLRQKRWYILLF